MTVPKATKLSWDQLFIKMTLLLGDRSTCVRMQVGAVLVKENRIISMGYNGVPKGKEHCNEHFADSKWSDPANEKLFLQEHHDFAIRNEIHAEMNAILFAARSDVSTEGTVMYASWSPCIQCAKAMLVAGITKSYFHKLYDREIEGVEFLRENGIVCEQIDI
jgi:dCMP deaminase